MAAADALIEVLHARQQLLGYLPAAVLAEVSRELALPLSKVQGVASFYHLFALEPPPRHRCAVCRGTACNVRGAARLLAALEQRLALRPGAGGWALEEVSCIGACSFGPLLLLDQQLCGPLPAADQAALGRCLDALAWPEGG